MQGRHKKLFLGSLWASRAIKKLTSETGIWTVCIIVCCVEAAVGNCITWGCICTAICWPPVNVTNCWAPWPPAVASRICSLATILLGTRFFVRLTWWCWEERLVAWASTTSALFSSESESEFESESSELKLDDELDSSALERCFFFTTLNEIS